MPLYTVAAKINARMGTQVPRRLQDHFQGLQLINLDALGILADHIFFIDKAAGEECVTLEDGSTKCDHCPAPVFDHGDTDHSGDIDMGTHLECLVDPNLFPTLKELTDLGDFDPIHMEDLTDLERDLPDLDLDITGPSQLSPPAEAKLTYIMEGDLAGGDLVDHDLEPTPGPGLEKIQPDLDQDKLWTDQELLDRCEAVLDLTPLFPELDFDTNLRQSPPQLSILTPEMGSPNCNPGSMEFSMGEVFPSSGLEPGLEDPFGGFGQQIEWELEL